MIGVILSTQGHRALTLPNLVKSMATFYPGPYWEIKTRNVTQKDPKRITVCIYIYSSPSGVWGWLSICQSVCLSVYPSISIDMVIRHPTLDPWLSTVHLGPQLLYAVVDWLGKVVLRFGCWKSKSWDEHGLSGLSPHLLQFCIVHVSFVGTRGFFVGASAGLGLKPMATSWLPSQWFWGYLGPSQFSIWVVSFRLDIAR